MRGVLGLMLLAPCCVSLYLSQCDELEDCTRDAGRICAKKHLTPATRTAAVEFLSCVDRTQFDGDGCYVENETAHDACRAAAPRAVRAYHDCLSELHEERYQAGTTGDACWTRCPPLCGDDWAAVDEWTDEESERYEDCKTLCQINFGCHAINELYSYDPVEDVARLSPAMAGGCREILDGGGDRVWARMWRGSVERLRLEEELRDPESDASIRLLGLIADLSDGYADDFFTDGVFDESYDDDAYDLESYDDEAADAYDL